MTLQPFAPPGLLTAQALAGQTVPGALGVSGAIPAGPQSAPLLELQATTGVNGFALQNATPTIFTWTAPSDGLLHRVRFMSVLHVTVAQTGGAVAFNWTAPFGGATVHTSTLFAGGAGTDTGGQLQNEFDVLVAAGSTVTLLQSSAMTLGTATVWAELWAS